MDVDRDPTDLGIPTWDGLTPTQRKAALAPLSAAALSGEPEPEPELEDALPGPRANLRNRTRYSRTIRKSMGWAPSRVGRLMKPCAVESCGAVPLHWCRRAGREVQGYVHPSRES
ncbi:MAG: hypothetical protein JWO67_6240 [Streptosporangiaceae bacterium]|nr:hypothetical protein [Streptosporangiaceae bacterium]